MISALTLVVTLNTKGCYQISTGQNVSFNFWQFPNIGGSSSVSMLMFFFFCDPFNLVLAGATPSNQICALLIFHFRAETLLAIVFSLLLHFWPSRAISWLKTGEVKTNFPIGWDTANEPTWWVHWENVFFEIFYRASCEKNHFHECQNVTSLGLFPRTSVFHDPQVINNP